MPFRYIPTQRDFAVTYWWWTPLLRLLNFEFWGVLFQTTKHSGRLKLVVTVWLKCCLVVPFRFKLNINSLAVVLCLWFADKRPNKIRCRCIWIMIIWHKNVPNRMSSLWASTDAPNHLLCMLIYTSDNYLLCFFGEIYIICRKSIEDGLMHTSTQNHDCILFSVSWKHFCS